MLEDEPVEVPTELRVERLSNPQFRASLGTRPIRSWKCTNASEHVVLYEGDRVVSYMGILLRRAHVNDVPVVLGGLAYSMTTEDRERSGCMTKVVERCIDELRGRGVDMVLLSCLDMLVPFYTRCGLTEVPNVWVEQPGIGTTIAPDEVHFLAQSFNSSIWPVRKIDLRGMPW